MYNPICKYCHNELGESNFKTWALVYKGYNSKARRSLFCNEECYKAYIKQFEVEKYRGNSIYMVEVDGEKRYMPYWFSPYYFTTIEDCRKRIDSPNVGICPTFFLKIRK